MSLTFDSLVAIIKNYLNRDDSQTLNQIPDFISLAESDLSFRSKNLGYVKSVKGNFTNNINVIPKPSLWRRSLSFNWGSGENNNTRNLLSLRTYEFIRAYWPDDTQTGEPLYYSDYDYQHLLFAPTPDQNYPFEFIYLEMIEPLSQFNQTNWFTNEAPNLLLYRSLLEATPYLKSDERIGVWKDYINEYLTALNIQSIERLVDRSSNVKSSS